MWNRQIIRQASGMCLLLCLLLVGITGCKTTKRAVGVNAEENAYLS